ncbi:MAG: penicillin-binding protein activator [Deltaproteobacteria bacterium]|nr:penicillin-binding protein activator [Deltaproteobacteria bacterium]
MQKPEVVRFMPWEIWPLGTDLAGQPFKSPLISEGDKELRAGRREQALEKYLQAQSGPLSGAEAEALVMRIASTELALDQPNKSLTTLSNYFRTSGKVVDDVDARFSLIFAYAYQRRGDLGQSMAWFARVAKVGLNQPGMRDAAERGVGTLVRSLPDDRLNEVSEQWSTETFIRVLVGEERSRRVAGGSIEDTQAGIWASNLPAGITDISGNATPIGVLLPLSGPFANLGKSVKNGIDLAAAGRTTSSGSTPELALLYRDAGAGADQAVGFARELVGTAGAKIILGPLLSEHALAVGDFARQSRVPLLALAKNSNFATGENVFRLGATVDSQVRSLLEVADKRLHVTRFAMVYPNDSAGRELADAFRVELTARGLALVYESSFSRGNFDSFVPIADSLEKSNAEAIFFPDSIVTASRFFGSLSADFRSRIRPLGVAMWDNQQQLSNSSAVLEGAVFVSPYFAASTRPAIVQFNQAYQSAYNQAPDFLAAQGFDALTIIAEAARRQRADGGALPMAIRQVDTYEGLTGRITVRSDGELQRQFSVVQMIGGKIQEIADPGNPSFVMHGEQPGEGMIHPITAGATAAQHRPS